ncbi:hypothetical protein NU08_2107 [Flavobacterium anhuiense]|uniref:Uncharacterized protein n=1 Tax=Flavobacterium anhuiense TaxID=459526 RepID=A0A444VZH6_9FLAO|nr:hypothetical protein NU08_2107 [Flavobacterium anhuiense]
MPDSENNMTKRISEADREVSIMIQNIVATAVRAIKKKKEYNLTTNKLLIGSNFDLSR